MARVKTRNLWSQEGGTKSINRPTPVTIAKHWAVEPDKLPSKDAAPRRRKLAPIRPNNRDAVAVPLGGQSYNPLDSEHQQALRKAVRQLAKKQRKDAKFVEQMTHGRDQQFQGSLTNNVTWEEAINDTAVKKKKPAPVKTAEQVKKEAKVAAKKDKKKKKLGKLGKEREARQAYHHRRHPNRDLEDVENLDDLLDAHEKHLKKLDKARLKRRQSKKENLQIKHYGRYYHQPLVVDVAPTDKLVGSLRHLNGSYVHPAMDRLKSLEERNLVPARMRHRFNKRNTLKPKGELRIKRESYGTLPETSF